MNKNTCAILATFAVLGSLLAIPALAEVDPALVERAVLPLPESLRAEAGIYRYDADTGERRTLREGSNSVECKVRDERMHTWCYPVSTAARRDYSAKLEAGGTEGEALAAAMAEAESAGKIKPLPAGSMLYRLDESEGGMRLLWVVMLPGLAAGDLGISTAGTFQSALKGMGTPWMMREATPIAHVMIPVNGTDLSNPGGADAPFDRDSVDPQVRATLPLPAALREGAMVVGYDPETGERELLREGTNSLFCVARDEATGFTLCYHESALPETDLRKKLAAQGKSSEEISAAVAAAIEAGDLPNRTFGSMIYRMSDNDSGVNLLWVLLVPGLTGAEAGMPTAGDREAVMAGHGTPWLMREGTNSAHLMIPVNGTELSNFD